MGGRKKVELRKHLEAITALRDALAHTQGGSVVQQEPIAWIEVERGVPMFAKFAKGYKPKGDGLIPLYSLLD